MSERKFTKEFEVYYYDTNKFQEATPLSIINYLEETAISHSEAAGLGVDRLKADNTGWVLNRWLFHMERYPKYGEKIVIQTWPSSFERFYANREYCILDAEDKTIGQVSSLWFFFNIERRRPMRIPMEIAGAYGINPQKVFDPSNAEIGRFTQADATKDFYVRRSDIDTNEHVNNASYLEWALELIPQDIYEQYMLTSLEVEYKKETGYGSAISSNIAYLPQKDDGSMEFSHSINSKEDGTTLAVAKTKWIKR